MASLKTRLAALADTNPDLIPYLAKLIGSCCRRIPDNIIRARVKTIMEEHPEFRDDLLPFTKLDLPVRKRKR